MNKRRKLVIAFGAAALTAPFCSLAQPQGKVWRVGVLVPRSRPVSFASDDLGAFPLGMRELGYVEGKNLVIEWRFADNKYERFPGLVAELVKMNVDVIVTTGTAATSAAQKSTTAIPFVMLNVNDPVVSGFVKSLSHPGGNITGLSNLAIELSPKHLEMLLSMVPKLSRVAVLVNPTNVSHAEVLKSVQASAQTRRVTILPVEARTAPDIEQAFFAMTQGNARAVIVPRDGFFIQQVRQIAELAAKHRLPAIAGIREYVEAGGLMSYGQNRADSFRRAATYVDKIFKGRKPADLPVEQPTIFELYINGKTAKALGLKIPYALQIMVDKVIQ